MKQILTFILISFLSVNLMAQTKVVKNPDTGLNVSKNVQITQIQLTDESTVVSFCVKGNSGGSIWVPKESYIQPVGAEKLFVKSATNVEIGAKTIIPETGKLEYQLIFPKIDKSVDMIDFGEDNRGGTWFIYDIELNKVAPIVPKQMMGKWYNSNGMLVAYFSRKEMIYNERKWKYVSMEEGKKLSYLTMREGDNEIRLALQLDDKTLAIGTEMTANLDVKKTGKFRIVKEKRTNYALTLCKDRAGVKDNKAFDKPFFSDEPAILEGYLLGYNTRIKIPRKKLYVDNVLTGGQENYDIEIDSNGHFKLAIPVLHTKVCYLQLAGIHAGVILESGKKLVVVGDYTNEKNVYFGESGLMNEEFSKLRNIGKFNYDDMIKKILDMTSEQYKSYCLKSMERGLTDLNKKKEQVGERAFRIAKDGIIYNHLGNLLFFDDRYKSTYRRKHKISYEQQRDLDIEIPEYSENYFDFLKSEMFNGQLGMMSNGYDTFINRIKYSELLKNNKNHFTTIDMIDTGLKVGISIPDTLVDVAKRYVELEKANSKLPFVNEYKAKYENLSFKFISAHQKELAEAVERYGSDHMLSNIEAFFDEKKYELSNEEREVIRATVKYAKSEEVKQLHEYARANQKTFELITKIINESGLKLWEINRIEHRTKVLKEKFGVENCWVNQIMNVQDLAGNIVDKMKPLSEAAMKSLKQYVHHPFIIKQVEKQNDRVLALIEENRKNTEYHFNETPKAEQGHLFEAIAKKYKGKVVLVDFWATWCSPCRSGIKKMKKVKKELKGKDVVFVYITNVTSPEKTYNNMICGIDGEHYRVTREEWKEFREKFGMTGIPHYTFVDKSGEVVDQKFKDWYNIEALKSRILQLLN